MKIHQITNFTSHAQRRAAQRGISQVRLAEILTDGEAVYKGGRIYTFYDNIVCVETDGTLVTVYRDKGGRRQIAKKPKYAK